MGKQPELKAGRRDPKSKAIIFDASPIDKRIDKLKKFIEALIDHYVPYQFASKLKEELDKI
jgi:tetrahydromethanopterin S-methyltransferase subunit B